MFAGKQVQCLADFGAPLHLRRRGLGLGSFQAAVLLPVNVWLILELRFTFVEGAWVRLTDIDRTFEQP